MLVWAKVSVEKETDGKSCVWQGKRCEVCTFLEEKITFTSKEGSDTYKIREGLHLDCSSENVTYLMTCKKCKKQYVDSCISSFRTCFNNYRGWHRKFFRDHSVIQVSFHTHFMLNEHCGIDHWEIILIDKGRDKQESRKNHSHKKRKDSLETRVVFSAILILTWNFGGGWGGSASTLASKSWFWCSRTIIDCFICYIMKI